MNDILEFCGWENLFIQGNFKKKKNSKYLGASPGLFSEVIAEFLKGTTSVFSFSCKENIENLPYTLICHLAGMRKHQFWVSALVVTKKYKSLLYKAANGWNKTTRYNKTI